VNAGHFEVSIAGHFEVFIAGHLEEELWTTGHFPEVGSGIK